MKIKKFLLLLFPVAALILELLPNGVVLHFANTEGEPWVRTYSHFALTPFGYANYGPLIASVLTCVLLLLAIAYFFKLSRGLKIAIMNVSGIASVAAFAPAILGIEYVTVIGVSAGLVLAAAFGVCFIKDK